MIKSFYLSRPFQNKSYKVLYWAGGTGGLGDFQVLLVIVGQSLHSWTYWGYKCVSAGSTISSQSTLTSPCAKLWRSRWVQTCPLILMVFLKIALTAIERVSVLTKLRMSQSKKCWLKERKHDLNLETNIGMFPINGFLSSVLLFYKRLI